MVLEQHMPHLFRCVSNIFHVLNFKIITGRFQHSPMFYFLGPVWGGGTFSIFYTALPGIILDKSSSTMLYHVLPSSHSSSKSFSMISTSPCSTANGTFYIIVSASQREHETRILKRNHKDINRAGLVGPAFISTSQSRGRVT